MTSKEMKTFKNLFHKYCKQEINKGHCEGDTCEWCPINKAYDEIFYTFYDESADLVLENDAYELDLKTGNIKVDKSVFDDFVLNTYINIHFVDDNVEDRIAQYKMISEDDEGIVMEYMGDL